MKALIERLELLVQARYPLLYLLSYEEERIERQLVARSAPLWRWRRTEGLRSPSGEYLPDTEEPLAALNAVESSIEESCLILLSDFHVALSDPMVVRRLRDLESVLGARSQAVIMVAPLLVLPSPPLECFEARSKTFLNVLMILKYILPIKTM